MLMYKRQSYFKMINKVQFLNRFYPSSNTSADLAKYACLVLMIQNKSKYCLGITLITWNNLTWNMHCSWICAFFAWLLQLCVSVGGKKKTQTPCLLFEYYCNDGLNLWFRVLRDTSLWPWRLCQGGSQAAKGFNCLVDLPKCHLFVFMGPCQFLY